MSQNIKCNFSVGAICAAKDKDKDNISVITEDAGQNRQSHRTEQIKDLCP